MHDRNVSWLWRQTKAMLVGKLAFLLSLKHGGAWNMWFLVEKMRSNGSVNLTSILPDILRRAGLPVLAVTMAAMMFGGQQALSLIHI